MDLMDVSRDMSKLVYPAIQSITNMVYNDMSGKQNYTKLPTIIHRQV